MNEEMRSHLDGLTERNVLAGLPPQEARFLAQRQFGNLDQIKERARDQRGISWIEELILDLRYAMRTLGKNPGMTATIVFTMALAIGASTGVFSVIDGLLLHPLGPDPHTEREIRIFETQSPKISESRVSAANFIDWKKQAKSFAFMRAGAGADLNLTGSGEPVHLVAGRATAELLGTHTWTLALGRGFLPEDDVPGKNKVIIVSYQIWQRLLGGDPRAIGRILQVNGESYTLIGVIGEEISRFSGADAFIPMAFTDQERAERGRRTLGVWGRLKPGVTLAEAQAEMNVLAAQLARQYPDTNQGWGVSLVPVNQLQYGSGLREALWALLGAVGCVLIIACANAANLLLARATARSREMAVRAALGAARARLVRQLLTESVLLSLLGGTAGVLFAHWGLAAVHGYAGSGMERLGYVGLNSGILAFALVLSMGTGLLFGLAPAWFAAGANLNDTLKRSLRGSGESGSRGQLRSALVMIEVALAMVLVAEAGGLIRRLVERGRLDPGFGAEHVTVLQLRLPQPKYAKPGEQVAFATAVVTHLRDVPGVQMASATTSLPIPQPGFGFQIDGRPSRPHSDWPVTSAYAVTSDYFSVMKIRLLQGRAFTAQDTPQSPRVAIINETLAKQYFQNENPIGRHIDLGGSGLDTWREIVGIVGDVTEFGDDTAVTPQVYEPFDQSPGPGLNFVVNSPEDGASILSSLKQQIYSVDKDQPVLSIRSLQSILDEQVAGQHFAVHLLGVFSLIALVIASVGIYAVVAYTVTQRTTEIGIRMALGAQTEDVLRLILTHGARLIGFGLLVGIGAALAVGRTVESLLYHVNTNDPLVLAAVTLLLVAVGVFACALPSYRATRVDPIVALRCE